MFYFLFNVIFISPFTCFKLHYDRYDKKFGSDGVHKTLEFEELESEIDMFKQDVIFTNIIYC